MSELMKHPRSTRKGSLYLRKQRLLGRIGSISIYLSLYIYVNVYPYILSGSSIQYFYSSVCRKCIWCSLMFFVQKLALTHFMVFNCLSMADSSCLAFDLFMLCWWINLFRVNEKKIVWYSRLSIVTMLMGLDSWFSKMVIEVVLARWGSSSVCVR